MREVVSPKAAAAKLTELWSPCVIAELDDSFVKVAKDDECLAMLVERKTTLHTGNEITEKTRSIADQLRPA